MSILSSLTGGLFGGGSGNSGSSSQSTSTSQQAYNDSRSVVSNDSHDVSSTNSNNTSNSLTNFNEWLSQVSNSLTNTNSGNTSISDSGNTSSFTQWLSSLTTNNSNSGNTSITDGRSTSTTYSSTDSRDQSNSGNTTINWTGTDAGALQLAQLQSQLLGAISGENVDALTALTRLGAGVGDNAYNLAAMASQNSMAASSHMLDLTGELIDKLATGTGNAVAENAAIAQATASQANALGSTASTQRLLLIGAAVLAGLIVLKNMTKG